MPEHLKKYEFPKGVSGNPKGRPKKYTTVLRDHGYKLSEINDTIQVMLSMAYDELVAVRNHDKATIMERTIANAMIKSLKNGSLYSMETLLSRVFGQPKQEIQADIQVQQPLFPDVTYDDVSKDDSDK